MVRFLPAIDGLSNRISRDTFTSRYSTNAIFLIIPSPSKYPRQCTGLLIIPQSISRQRFSPILARAFYLTPHFIPFQQYSNISPRVQRQILDATGCVLLLPPVVHANAAKHFRRSLSVKEPCVKRAWRTKMRLTIGNAKSIKSHYFFRLQKSLEQAFYDIQLLSTQTVLCHKSIQDAKRQVCDHFNK